MFKNSMYICCSVRGKIMLLRNNITNSNCDKAAEELKKLVNIYYDDIDLNVAFKTVRMTILVKRNVPSRKD